MSRLGRYLMGEVEDVQFVSQSRGLAAESRELLQLIPNGSDGDDDREGFYCSVEKSLICGTSNTCECGTPLPDGTTRVPMVREIENGRLQALAPARVDCRPDPFAWNKAW